LQLRWSHAAPPPPLPILNFFLSWLKPPIFMTQRGARPVPLQLSVPNAVNLFTSALYHSNKISSFHPLLIPPTSPEIPRPLPQLRDGTTRPKVLRVGSILSFPPLFFCILQSPPDKVVASFRSAHLQTTTFLRPPLLTPADPPNLDPSPF